jgi:transcription-repair coupling factor (superfamily II helicase)
MDQNQEINYNPVLIEQLVQQHQRIEIIGLSGSERAYLTARLYKKRPTPFLVILPTAKQAERFFHDLRFFAPRPHASIIYFPPYNILPFTFLAYHNETASSRIRALHRLLEYEQPPLVVTSIEALLQKIIPRQVITQYAELIMKNEDIDREQLIDKLICGGYIRSTIVEEPGDFSVRGGIIDIFSPLYSDPLRIELFGDQVDSIRFFSASSQRKFKDVDEAIILPAKEVVLNRTKWIFG